MEALFVQLDIENITANSKILFIVCKCKIEYIKSKKTLYCNITALYIDLKLKKSITLLFGYF